MMPHGLEQSQDTSAPRLTGNGALPHVTGSTPGGLTKLSLPGAAGAPAGSRHPRPSVTPTASAGTTRPRQALSLQKAPPPSWAPSRAHAPPVDTCQEVAAAPGVKGPPRAPWEL